MRACAVAACDRPARVTMCHRCWGLVPWQLRRMVLRTLHQTQTNPRSDGARAGWDAACRAAAGSVSIR